MPEPDTIIAELGFPPRPAGGHFGLGLAEPGPEPGR